MLLFESVPDRAGLGISEPRLSRFEQPFTIDDEDLLVSASLGVALYDAAHTAAELVQ